jgi:hypothetical protein
VISGASLAAMDAPAAWIMPAAAALVVILAAWGTFERRRKIHERTLDDIS